MSTASIIDRERRVSEVAKPTSVAFDGPDRGPSEQRFEGKVK